MADSSEFGNGKDQKRRRLENPVSRIGFSSVPVLTLVDVEALSTSPAPPAPPKIFPMQESVIPGTPVSNKPQPVVCSTAKPFPTLPLPIPLSHHEQKLADVTLDAFSTPNYSLTISARPRASHNPPSQPPHALSGLLDEPKYPRLAELPNEEIHFPLDTSQRDASTPRSRHEMTAASAHGPPSSTSLGTHSASVPVNPVSDIDSFVDLHQINNRRVMDLRIVPGAEKCRSPS